MKLYAYQEVGAAFLASHKAAILADEMGAGKCAQTIAACDAVSAVDIVVICPASVRENWRREFAKFGADRERRLQVWSYDQAHKVPAGPIDVLVLDEAQYLKTPKAKRTRTVYGEKCDGVGGLVERSARVFALSGTIMPNNPSEVWPHLRALFPESILSSAGKPYSIHQFISKFCKTRDNGFGIQIVGAKNHDLLREKLQPFMLRRTKAEVLPDLPEISFDELFVEGRIGVAGPEADKVRAALEADGVEGLKRIAPHVATLRRLTGMAKVEPVVEWVREWLDGCDRKIVLFAHHKEVVQRLVDAFQSAMFIDGGVSAPFRQMAIDAFQTNPLCRVFIGQNTAAGTGITLTAASDLLLLEPSWTPSDNAQIAGRIHRIGQRNGCQVRFVTMAGSVDEQINRVLTRKTADIGLILDA